MKWFIESQDSYTTIWILQQGTKILAKVQVFRNGTAGYWFSPNTVATPAPSEERAKQLVIEEVTRCMAPIPAKPMAVVRAPFGINRVKLSGSLLPRFRLFRTSAFFYTLFELFKFEDQGFLLFTICLWYRAFQIQLSYPASWINSRVSHRFPKHRLLSIQDNRK